MRRTTPQVTCVKCGNVMRLDDQDEESRGIYKYWFACDSCGISCVLDGKTGDMEWDSGSETDDDLPF